MSRFFEEFEVAAVYPTYCRTVTEGEIAMFCSFVGYHVPLFIDEEYAKTTLYGGRIAPSSFTMSISTGMTEGLYRNSVVALLAVENGKFLAPMRAGDTIRTEVEVIEKKPTSSAEHGLIVFRDHVYNQRNEKVFQIDKVTLIRKQPVALA